MAKFPGRDPHEPTTERRGSRNMIIPDASIPGNTPDLNGGYREVDPDKNDTVLLGHPEAAGQFTRNFDNRSMYLDDAPTREDLNYVSPEEIRRRSKYGGSW